MKQNGVRRAAGVIVTRETADGARFLLVRRQGEWRFPVALADDVDSAIVAVLADARTAAAVSGRPTRLPGAYGTSGEGVHGAAAGTGATDGATVFVLATVSSDEAAPVARTTAAEAETEVTEAADAEAQADGVSSSQGSQCRWVTLDEGLQLIAGSHRGALVWAAARIMHEATLARPESRQRLD